MPRKKKKAKRNTAQALPLCPYFKREERGYAYCELCRFKFGDAKERRDVIYRFCAHPTGFTECQFYTIISDYWERSEKDGKQ